MIRYLFLSFFIFFWFSESHSKSICENYVNQAFASDISRIDTLERKCKQGGGHVPISDQERKISCTVYQDIMANVQKVQSECSVGMANKTQCESEGNMWVHRGSGIPYEGYCQMGCADGTELSGTSSGGEELPFCLCPKGSQLTFIDVGEPLAACQPPQTRTVCIEPTGMFANSQAAQAEYEDCLANERQKQRQENEAQAQTEAKEAAEANLAQAIQAARSNSAAECRQQAQGFISQCQSVSAQAIPASSQSSGSASTAAECERLKSLGQSTVSQIDTQVQNCINTFSQLANSCPLNTPPQNTTGSATVSTGQETLGSAVVVTAEDTATGSGQIPENQQQLSQAQEIITNLTSQSSQIASEMSDWQAQVDQCVARFETEEDTSTPTGNNWGQIGALGLGSAAALKTALDGGSSELSGSGGYGGSGGVAGGAGAAAPYNPTEAANGSNFSSSGKVGGGSLNTDSSRSLPPPGVSSSTELDDNGFNLNNGTASDGTNAAGTAGNAGLPQNGGLGALAGGAMAGGVGRGLSFSNDDTNFNVTDEKGNRVYTNSDQRNLVQGYKKSKPGGGGFATYKPEDLQKYGKENMRKALDEARKEYGNHTPLLFKDGKFVRDILEMKNSVAWQKHNERQKRRISGESPIDKTVDVQEYFHPCHRFGECFTESSYNIFRLHRFKYKRTFYPGKD